MPVENSDDEKYYPHVCDGQMSCSFLLWTVPGDRYKTRHLTYMRYILKNNN